MTPGSSPLSCRPQGPKTIGGRSRAEIAAAPDRGSLGTGPAQDVWDTFGGLMRENGSATARSNPATRQTIIALALAGVLPCAALVRPEVVPREIVVLGLIAWMGIFVAVWRSLATDQRCVRNRLRDGAAAQRTVSRS
jgi:hypothetical protein